MHARGEGSAHPRSGARLVASALLLALLLLAAVPGNSVTAGSKPGPVVGGKIMGGVAASISEVPWVALVETPDGMCTGTVVSPRWVLTAAHCFTSPSADGVFAFLGGDRLDDSIPEILPARRIVLHPQWDPMADRSDLALIELSQATNVPAIRLAADDAPDPVGANALITGWGMLDEVNATEQLMRANVPVLPDTDCTGAYGAGYHAATMICAGGQGVDVCAGDSGGPLVTGSGADRTQIGVVAFGEVCRPASSTIGAYTSIGAHRSWIDSTIGGTAPPRAFSDVSGTNPHATSIAAVAAAGITGGYPDGTYRPEAPVSRAQMATFLMRAAELVDPGVDRFPDVASTHTHAPGIRAVAGAQIAGGYPDGTYRPDASVTRGQMATFLTRAAGLPPASTLARFPDVASTHPHAAGIDAVAAAEITGGYPDGTYRPDTAVSRGQMATFLARAFLDTRTPPEDPLPDLDALAEACRGWDPAACDELYQRAVPGSAEERLGDTCGDRIPDGTGLWCVDALSDPLTRPCFEGDMRACDDLYETSPVDSFDETIGDTCAFRQPAGTGRWCVEVFG